MTIITFILIMFGGKLTLNKLNFSSFLFPFTITFIGWLIQGASEEIMIRGHMLPVITKKIKLPFGILISSLYFGSLHLLNPNINFLSFFNIVLFGTFACFYTLFDDSLWGICAYHSSWNFFQGTVFGHSVSGLKNDISIFTFRNISENTLNGGIFGPEASVVATILLVFSLFVVIFLQYAVNNVTDI